MEWLDRFVDTRQKRYHLFFLILQSCLLLMVLPYLYIGMRLLLLDSYDALYGMLEDPMLSYAYVSRLVLEMISIADLTLPRILASVLSCVQPFEIMVALMLLFCFPILERKKITRIVLILLVIETIVIFACVFLGLHASSLAQAIGYVRLLGGTLFFIALLLVLLLSYYLYYRLRYYRYALSYQCIEEKEHME